MRQKAFSLLELMLVVVIMVVILSFALPSLDSVLRGGAITRAGQLVGDQIASARQAAVARNQMVMVRLLKLPGEMGGSETRFRAIQTVVQEDDGTLRSLSRVVKFEETTQIAEGAQLSTLVSDPTVTGSTEVGGKRVSYVGFRFRPDGTTDLDHTSADGWFLTITGTLPANSAVPKNFYTIRLDPYTGQTRVFRP